RERLIKSYTPFILKTASKVSGRYVRLGEDDEVSVSLMAFNEAIDCFDTARNHSFLSFAETVIKRRLIDYFRKETAFTKKVVPLSSFEQDDGDNEGTYYYLESKQSIEVYQEKNAIAERKEEILQFTKKLSDFGISFQELVSISPKHEDARIRAMEVAKIIASDADMSNHLITKKELPLKQLEANVGISRKTLERQRKYIIAITLVFISDFEYLKQYLVKVI
ncbi:MAG TPA: RNA polymerase sigma factor SigI, partial [Desulfobacteria bacterium]|nr:RNA polymerase sigma factor SigI [Desulfobacteria bacterium]